MSSQENLFCRKDMGRPWLGPSLRLLQLFLKKGRNKENDFHKCGKENENKKNSMSRFTKYNSFWNTAYLKKKIQVNILKTPDQKGWKTTLVICVLFLGKEKLPTMKIKVNSWMQPYKPNNQSIYIMLNLSLLQYFLWLVTWTHISLIF